MASMYSPDINLLHFILRLLIAVGSLISAIFKIPFIIYAFQFVTDFLLKMNKGESGGSSGSPSGEAGTSSSDPPASKTFDLPMVELAINVILLIILFVAVMVVLIRTVYTIALNRLVDIYSYLIIMGLWIVFVLISIMADGWKGPLNYAILGARTLLVGFYALKAPSTWHFILLRTSIIVDIVAYPVMIGIAILNLKYNFRKVNGDRKVGVWTRYNNLIRTL